MGWLIVILILSPFIAVILAFAVAIFTLGCATLVGVFAKITGK